MATTRVALGSILGTVTDAATTISTIFGTVNSAAEIALNYVNDVKDSQEISMLLGKEDRETQILERISDDTTKRHIDRQDYFSKNPEAQAIYEATYADLQTKLNAYKLQRNPSQLKAA